MQAKKLLSGAATVFSGVLCAYTAWGVTASLILFSSALFFVFLLAKERRTVFLFSLGYHAMLSRGLLESVAHYYHSMVLGVGMWVLFTGISTALYLFFWHQHFRRRLLHFPLLVIALTLPPVGFIYAASPLTAAGIVFPGFGMAGIVLYLLSVEAIAAALNWCCRWYVQAVCIVVILFFAASSWEERVGSRQYVQPTVSRFLYTPAGLNQQEKEAIAKKLIVKSNRLNARGILFYENALGNFTPRDYLLWQRGLDPGKKVYAGAHIYDLNQKLYDNVLMRLSPEEYKVLYKQRIPMPFSMWKPFTGEGAKLHLLSNPVVVDEGNKIGVFICYEQLLAFPVLHTMMYNPSMIFAISNLWWSRDDTFLDAQRFSMTAWASLMGVPLYYAFNNRVYKSTIDATSR